MDLKHIKSNGQTTNYSHYAIINLLYPKSYLISLSYPRFYNADLVYLK